MFLELIFNALIACVMVIAIAGTVAVCAFLVDCFRDDEDEEL